MVVTIEADMAVCPKCHTDMVIKGGRMTCPNQYCNYVGWEIPIRVPSQAELLKENEQLKQKLQRIKEMVGDMEINYLSLKEIKKLIINL